MTEETEKFDSGYISGHKAASLIARLEQRQDDHERIDERARSAAMWISGFIFLAIVGINGAMWNYLKTTADHLNIVDGRQQVVLSTLTDFRSQLIDIRATHKELQNSLYFQNKNPK